MTNRVPTQPFQDWIERRIEKYAQSDGVTRVAFDLGINTKKLYCFRNGFSQTTVNRETVKVSTDSYKRDEVEEMLWHADCFLWEVYSQDEFPELYEEEAA